ncbi:hypothetical protein ABIE91_009431 [Bradyrhizobium elkanii]
MRVEFLPDAAADARSTGRAWRNGQPNRSSLLAGAAVAMVLLSGCASAPMTRGGSLASYDNLTPSDGVLAKSLVRVNKDEVLAAKTVRIVPTTFAQAASPTLSQEQRHLVANAIDRSLCVGLSERLQVVGPDQPADLSVHALVTQAAPTDEAAAGTSKVVSFLPSALGAGVPVPVPRLPVGLGSLTVEAEVRDQASRQQAAMIWARGANSFTNSPMASRAPVTPTISPLPSATISASSSSPARRHSERRRSCHRSTRLAQRSAASRNTRPARRSAAVPAWSEWPPASSACRRNGRTRRRRQLANRQPSRRSSSAPPGRAWRRRHSAGAARA